MEILLIIILCMLITSLIIINITRYTDELPLEKYSSEDWKMFWFFSVIFPITWIVIIIEFSNTDFLTFLTKERNFRKVKKVKKGVDIKK